MNDLENELIENSGSVVAYEEKNRVVISQGKSMYDSGGKYTGKELIYDEVRDNIEVNSVYFDDPSEKHLGTVNTNIISVDDAKYILERFVEDGKNE